ncbi:MAG: tetratricopeptide repeat protein [Methanomicrobiales archaeon]|nr:tetratricopeptide repeat protein [Methanomicrobiales archaeon]
MGIRDWIGSQEASPANPFCQKGESHLARERFDDAIQNFNRGLELDRVHVGCWIGMGRAYLGLKKYDRADDCFVRALEIIPDNPDAMAMRASVLRLIALQNQDPMRCLEAVELLNKTLKMSPDSSLALHEKGMALWTLGKRDEAMVLFDQAKKSDSHYLYPFDLKGRYLFEKRLFHEAIDAYEEALQKKPQDPDLMFQQGRALMKIGGYHSAINYFKKCLKIRPEFSSAWLLLGNSHKVLHNYDDAINAYEEAMEHDPGSTKYRKYIADVYLVKGKEALYKDGEYRASIEFFDQTIRIIPNHVTAWFSKGVAYKKLGAYRNATACFLRIVEIDPQNAHAYYEMAQILEKTRNIDESIRCYVETVRCDPSHTDAMFKLGNLLLESGDYKNAIAYFDRVLDKKPESSVTWFAKGKALQKRGQQKDAERCFERADKLATR